MRKRGEGGGGGERKHTCTRYLAAHPYQKNVIGMKQAKKTIAGKRISGSKTPLLALVMRITVASERRATYIIKISRFLLSGDLNCG